MRILLAQGLNNFHIGRHGEIVFGPQPWWSQLQAIDIIGGICLVVSILLMIYGHQRKKKAGASPATAQKETETAVPELIPGLLTMHQAAEGLVITGGIGSGKTTGPGSEIALNLLRQGAGCCVMAAKPDEAGRWQEMCREAGRITDYVRFAPNTGLCCDLLNAELQHPQATVESAAQLLDVLVQVSSRQSSGRGDDVFWNLLSQKIFRRAIATVWFAKRKASLSDIYKLITSAPEDMELVGPDREGDAAGNAKRQEWRRSSFLAECLMEGNEKVKEYPQHAQDMELCGDFWLHEWPSLSEKTRSIGHTMTTNVLDKFLSGPIREMVSSGKSNVHPEDVTKRKVICLDMNVLQWREPGEFFQIIFKTLVQRAVLRREVTPDICPCVLWSDEAQFFIVPDIDGMVQTVARQSKLISVVLTQNLPMLYASCGGGEKARQDIDGWLANHATKIMCANSCAQTNEFQSKVIGDSKQNMLSGNVNHGQLDLFSGTLGQDKGTSGGFSQHWHADVPAHVYTKLRKGGPPDFIVEAIIFQNGRRYANNLNKTWCRHAFKQRIN